MSMYCRYSDQWRDVFQGTDQLHTTMLGRAKENATNIRELHRNMQEHCDDITPPDPDYIFSWFVSWFSWFRGQVGFLQLC